MLLNILQCTGQLHTIEWSGRRMSVVPELIKPAVDRRCGCPFKSDMPGQFTSVHSPHEITTEEEPLEEGCPVEIERELH